MVVLILCLLYIVISIALYIFCKNLYANNKLKYFVAPKQKFIYYLLSFTWGLPMNIVGCICALIFIIMGKRPKKHGWNYYFEFDVDFGLELGIFFISPVNGSTSLKNHEFGHSIQNIWLGIFTPLVVSIPSAVRFWIREYQQKFHPEKKLEPYDLIWFEATATSSGYHFMETHN